MRKLFFIINPISGNGKNTSLEKFISSNLVRQTEIQYEIRHTLHGGHASELTREALDHHFDAVIVAGGDGTINEVASHLVNTNTALGIIPVGSGNGVARHFKVPFNIKKNLDMIIRGKTTLLDVGTANNKIFLSNAGLGYDAAVIKDYAYQQRHGFISYFFSAIRSTFFFSVPKVHLSVNGNAFPVNAFFFSALNGSQFGYNISLDRNARTDDGLLDFVILDTKSRLKAIFVAICVLFKGKPRLEGFTTVHSQNATVHFPGQRLSLQIDGEPSVVEDQLEFKVLPGAIKVIVP
ncbi:MAG: diacylglycerol kinase family lipid kinase [Bacteroidota bacterium]|nr:diacylglycerol kinase family lipid kinase [Bacteroidota bacterium]MDP4205742.1 diacylglycerol kinase family lipid kinase [Bacteroidota bacterium]